MILSEYLKFYSELGVTHLRPEARPATQRPVATATAPALAPSSEDGSQRGVTLEAIGQGIGDCARCRLAATRKHIVFGAGNPRAELMFVGEAPGEDEDVQGLPFVGRAGQLLTKIIEAIDLKRDQVYIANVIKCRPPDNRAPQPDEIAACRGFLSEQIEAIRPLLIVTLGRYATQTLLDSEVSITKVRGRFFDYRGIPLLPTFHPSYLLRNPAGKREVWEDMKTVRARLKELGSAYYT